MPPFVIHARLRPLCSFVLFVVIVGLAVASQAAVPLESLPTQDEIHQLFEQGQYPLVLQKIAKVLALRADAAKDYNRHDLLRLKAETHLRLKAYGAAEQAFTAAAKETPDDTPACIDLATAVLIHRSKGGKYQPVENVKGRMADAISAVDLEARHAALQALFRDELAAVSPRIKLIRDTKSLDPLADIAPAITTLQIIEMGATEGTDEQTRQLLSEFATHAREVMGNAVQDMIQRMDGIIRRAGRPLVNVPTRAMQPLGKLQQPNQHPEIDGGDLRLLPQIRAACDKIGIAARALGNAMGPDGRDLIDISIQAERITHKVDDLTQ